MQPRYFGMASSSYRLVLGRRSSRLIARLGPLHLAYRPRLFLVIGRILGIVGILESMIRQRRLPMKYAELLALREQTIRDKFLREVTATDKQKEEYQQLLVRIAQEADRDLNKQLEDLFGITEARRILERKRETEGAAL